MFKNRLKEKIRSGRPAIGSWIAFSRSTVGRRLYISITLVALLALALVRDQAQTQPGAVDSSLPEWMKDLREIVADEHRADPYDGNVYSLLGNRLQLEGDAYDSVSQALNAYDLLSIIHASTMPEAARKEELSRQRDQVRQAFEILAAALPWPRLDIEIAGGKIRWTGSELPELFESIPQQILIRIDNSDASRASVRLQSPELWPDRKEFSVESGAVRYAAVRVLAPDEGTWSANLRVETPSASATIPIVAQVQRSVLIEGQLSSGEGDLEAPIARIRVTDARGRYYPTDFHEFGSIAPIILAVPRRKPMRWNYAERQFRVRVPAGKTTIRLRRSLEYKPVDDEFETGQSRTIRRQYRLDRWRNMEREKWYSGDTHLHWLDPKSALFNARAENLNVSEVLLYEEAGQTYSREFFSGAPDPLSDERHVIKYDEEYRNNPLGHVGLLSLRSVVTPMSTGGLGVRRPLFWRNTGPHPRTVPQHGDPSSPDYPLLLDAMRKTHAQGGTVNWAHLRATTAAEFAIDAVHGEIDTADILTNTSMVRDLPAWYALLNCGFRIPATAGTDGTGTIDPVGHNRVYVKLESAFTYANWIAGLKKGSSFVTNGPMTFLSVGGRDVGEQIDLDSPQSIPIHAEVESWLPVETLEILVNGEVAESIRVPAGSRRASLDIRLPVNRSLWIAARCTGPNHPELFWTHPVFAHTNPVYVRYRGAPVLVPQSACYLLDFVKPLQQWVAGQAFFQNEQQKRSATDTVQSAIDRLSAMCGPSP